MWECVCQCVCVSSSVCVCGYAYKYNEFLLAKILLPLTDMIISCMSPSSSLPFSLSLFFSLS